MSDASSDTTASLSRRLLEARVRVATMSCSGTAGRVEVGKAWRCLRATPDLRPAPFRPYHVQLLSGHLGAVVLVPTWNSQPTTGHLGVEIVSPEGRIAARAITELAHQRSGQPAVLTFPAIATSEPGRFELRVFVRGADAAVHVMEYAWPVPVPRRRRFGAVLLCGLGFCVPGPAGGDGAERGGARDSPADPLVRIEHPPHREVEVARGVLSVRGWAWSELFGPGEVLVRVTGGDTPALVRRATHRLCRPDLAGQWPVIPPTGTPGFELSIDRSELPARSRAEVVFAVGGQEWPVATLEVVASHNELGIGADLVACQGCGADEAGVIARKDGLDVVRCPRCHLAYTNPRPSWAQIAQRYSKEYFQAEYLPSIEGALDANRARWNYYLDQIERFKQAGPSLLEVGAGAGHLLREAAARGWTAQGIELNPWAVEHARRELHVDVHEGDVEAPDFEFPGGGFGAIVLDSVLEHFRWPRQVIARCARALRPGGGLLIWTMASDGDILTREGAAFMYFGPSEHLFYFSASSLCRMCEDAGLRVEHLGRDESADSVIVVARRRLDVDSAPAPRPDRLWT